MKFRSLFIFLIFIVSTNVLLKAADESTLQQYLNQLFEDKACTVLRAEVNTAGIANNPNYMALPDTLRTMITKIISGTWDEENIYNKNVIKWDGKYAKKYRVQLYEPFSEGALASNMLKVKTYTNFLPEEYVKRTDLSACKIYFPGIYFANRFGATFGATPASAPAIRPLAVSSASQLVAPPFYATADLSTLKNASAGKIQIETEKNGAKARYTINVKIGANDPITSSITDVTFGEDIDAICYNLQGIQINNPTNGTYIRILNGKAEKIIL